MKKQNISILQITVTASLLLNVMFNGNIVGFGSGVIVLYKSRYFLCTAEHLIKANKNSIGIQRGLPTNDQVEMLIFNDFSFLSSINLNNIALEDIISAIQAFDGTNILDIAIKEVPLLDQIIQPSTQIIIDRETINIPHGGKYIISIDNKYILNRKSTFSLAGTIDTQKRQDNRNLIKPKLILDMKFSSISDFFIEFDLGHSIKNHSYFKGCSGAPIFDNDGNLVALLTGGAKDATKRFVYGFRFDVIKEYIDILYFNESLDQALAISPN